MGTLSLLPAIVGVLGLVLLLVLIHEAFASHPLSPIAVFCYMVGFFYVARAGAVAVRLDTPYPDNLFDLPPSRWLLTKASWPSASTSTASRLPPTLSSR